MEKKNQRFSEEETQYILNYIDNDITGSRKFVLCKKLKQDLFSRFGTKRTEQSIAFRYYQFRKKEPVYKPKVYHDDPVKNDEAAKLIERSSRLKMSDIFLTMEKLSPKELKLINAFTEYLTTP